MVRLILQRNRLTLLAFVVIPAAVAIVAAAWLLRPQATSSAPLGDPNAPVVAATPAPFVGGQPPIARPAAVPVAASRADDGAPGGEPANLIEARMPDARYHDAAFAAVQCAVGRPLTRDPEFDALAVEAWRASVMHGDERVEAMVREHPRVKRIGFFLFIPDETPSSDPCIFGGNDFRNERLLFEQATTIGVAVFPSSSANYPVGTLVIVRDH
ncbi:hypothetical protein [Roseiflexus sp.]|uniref:hypothetical protein n=1 Tax=Roseiflexus sp. TaxID=2562120 RepID=UPI0021DB8E6E|nr:hypothetical protein [Roseiflexus sp.]GIW02596.1 MAG: hypothetical protein KatS3mg058_3999 [Roseiflexus sp.]